MEWSLFSAFPYGVKIPGASRQVRETRPLGASVRWLSKLASQIKAGQQPQILIVR